jgi:shikimate kinase
MSGSNKSEKQMRNTMIYLIGFAGAGKFTIAKEICKSAEARLVDNHLINNPIAFNI